MIEYKKTSKGRGRPKSDLGTELRKIILQVSLNVLNEGGPEALSIREVARRSGCTHQAPYNYFEDRESLLATLVCEGFHRLSVKLKAATRLANKNFVRATLIQSGKAYINFAMNNQGLFRVMFRPDVCSPIRFPDVFESGMKAYAELELLNKIVFEKSANLTSSTLLWSQVHGFACLMIDGPLQSEFATTQKKKAHLNEVANMFADIVLAHHKRQV